MWPFKKKVVVPEPPPSPEEIRIHELYKQLHGLSYKQIIWLWGLLEHSPDSLTHPDEFTKINLAGIQANIGVEYFDNILQADPKELVAACKWQKNAWQAAAFLS